VIVTLGPDCSVVFEEIEASAVCRPTPENWLDEIASKVRLLVPLGQSPVAATSTPELSNRAHLSESVPSTADGTIFPNATPSLPRRNTSPNVAATMSPGSPLDPVCRPITEYAAPSRIFASVTAL